MKRTSAFCAVAVGLFAFTPKPAEALNVHTWVSNAGADNPGCGGISSPCQSLYFAVGETQAGGEISCRDPIWSQPTNIQKSITIVCEVTNNATSTVSVPGYITIAIGPDDVVTLRGLNIDGGGYGSPGIRFGDSSASSGTLVLDNVTITGYGGSGILFAPTGPSRLIVTNSLLSRNGSGTTGAAIRVLPQSGASAFVSITKSVIVANIYGLAIDTTAGGAGINVLISDSEVSANKLDGIITVANPGPIGVTADLTRLADNGQFGIRSYGAASTIRAGRSTITGNGTGVVSQNGGKMLTYGSNFLEGNGTKGTFTGALTSE